MPDQKVQTSPVSARGVVVQVDAVARVGVDVGFEGAGGGEGLARAGWDRGRLAGRRAVAAAEDEVLVCVRGGGLLLLLLLLNVR